MFSFFYNLEIFGVYGKIYYQECYQDYLSEVKSYGGSIQFIPNEYKTP